MGELDQHRSNGIFASLSVDEALGLLPYLEIVKLPTGTVLAEPGSSLEYAYFPHSGVICYMASLRTGLAEVAMVGPEGFVGFEALLGRNTSSERVLVRVGGTASRVPIAKLLPAVEQSASLRRGLLAYVRYFVVHILQSVACNGQHSIQERCARWLLMAHDRAGADSFDLTHKLLAEVLGNQRPSVSNVLRAMQDAGLIQYRRGRLTIADRVGLEAIACECYATVR